MYFWLLTRVELSDNQKVQKFSLNFLIIRKFNPCVVELSEVELSDYIHLSDKRENRCIFSECEVPNLLGLPDFSMQANPKPYQK